MIGTFTSDGSGGHFKDGCKLGDGTIEWELIYDVYDVVGEHSPHNCCLKGRGD